MTDEELKPETLRVDTWSAGMHRVRVTHLPSGLSVTAENASLLAARHMATDALARLVAAQREATNQ